jgi:nucleoside-diphosphate-sugar epimerase
VNGNRNRRRLKMNWKNRNVIVTGGSGVIGRELIKKLISLDANVRCFDIVPKPRYIPKLVEYFRRDLTSLDPKEFIEFEPEIIFHLAATFERTKETLSFWKRNFKNNVILTHNILDAAKKCSYLKRFLFASSYLVYSPNLYLHKNPPNNSVKLSENDPINPRNLCGSTKYYSEKELEYLKNFDKFNFTYVSARIFRVYGPGSRDVVSRWVRASLKGRKIKVYGRENSFDFIFSSDVAEGLIKLAESDVRGPVNLGTGASDKIGEVIKNLRREIPEIKIEELKKRILYESSVADITKLRKETKWKPKIELEEGIKTLVDYERKRLVRN